jgi:hypothetical protein
VTLDLGGLGVRALSVWRGRYLIAAGPFDRGPAARLFTWPGAGAALPVAGVDVKDYNPEAFFSTDDGERILMLSDDGSLSVDGEECKRLEDPASRRFRGVWVHIP